MLFFSGVTRDFAEEASDTKPHIFLKLLRLRKGFVAAGSESSDSTGLFPPAVVVTPK